MATDKKTEDQKAPGKRVHIVQKGDTLRSIARTYLGDPNRAAQIRKENDLATDNILRIGRELIIPDK